MASVRSPTSRVKSSLVTRSSATQTPCGDRDRRWRASAGMPVGTEIARAHPAPIGAVWMWAAMPRGVHLARASPAGGDRRRGGRWQSRWSLCCLLTGRTVRLPGETRKRLRVAGAFVRWRDGLGCPLIPCGAIAWPCIVEHDTQPQEAQQQQLIEKQVRYHGKVPLTRLRKGELVASFVN